MSSIEIQSGSGNVFADLNLENSTELLVKAELARQIKRLIEHQQMTQAIAAEILGIDQPKVSALMNGKLSGFSIPRLFRFLNALGQDVEIIVREKPLAHAKASTSVRTMRRRSLASARLRAIWERNQAMAVPRQLRQLSENNDRTGDRDSATESEL
jgi:predicted XRE-type DNA-binding protein